MIRLLVYQYRDLFDPGYGQDQCRRFEDFVKNRLGLNLEKELAQESDKVIRFSYPDLEYHNVDKPLLLSLKQDFGNTLSNTAIESIYVVYPRQKSPHIGFTASVVFELTLDVADQQELKTLFTPERSRPSKFHKEFKIAWESVADKRQTLPVAVFVDEGGPWLFAEHRKFDDLIFGSVEKATLLCGRFISLERGFPYVSYVLHAGVSAVVPENIQKCDFAILMALPGFVEKKLELIRKYREKLTDVQKKLEQNHFADAERLYSRAWKDFEAIQGLMPTTMAAVQRIKQKYPGKSVFATIANDNTQLIQSTVNAAIKATEQVRANIQSYAERRLQRSVNRLQGLTVLLTVILVGASAITAYVAFWGTTNTQVTNFRQPILVSSEPTEDRFTGAKTSLIIMPLPGPALYPMKTAVSIEFSKNTTEIPVILPTPLAVPGRSPIDLLILEEDGAVLAEGSLAVANPPGAVKFFVDRALFKAGHRYYVEVKQDDPAWRVRLPVEVTFVK